MTNANKKRRRSTIRGGNDTGGSPTAQEARAKGGGANPERRERKEQARAAREAERKRAARSASARRAGIFAGVGLAAFGILFWLQRPPSANPLPAAATTAINAAGCRYDASPSDAPSGGHLPSGGATAYPSVPATSGQHDPSPLEPTVYPEAVPETRAVHLLEHSGVIVYYQNGGDAALPQPVVQRLTSTVNDSKNMALAPRPDLPADTSLSVVAWNKVANCGSDVTADQAVEIAKGFVDAFSCTSNAPEPDQGEC
jgi:Protein of unknown function (DUF3105)